MSNPTNPSRDLLFGLLALQNGLIDQGGLFAAFAAWTRDKSRSLADHLVELGHLDPPRRAAVEAIAGVHVQALGGDIEKSLAVLAVGRFTRESLVRAGGPDVEATLEQIRSAPGSTRDDDDPDRTGSYSVGSATSDGQRFRILRPHARGGLGAVFVALDGELHREVALKQILEKHADDPVSRHRFVAEAEITGGLEHPGVVPVYGLGTDAGGRPYYAMRFIKGDSLKEAIALFHKNGALEADPGRRSLELRKLLRRFIDVCNAVDYAHSRGVIHRDLKPANIVVGKYGETLVVDWGLAKAVGRADPSVGEQTLAPSSGGSSETLPGSALGTPAYMSPEQARGELNRLGPRSDVYSLGATLYCLLTGKPPVEGDDIGAVLHAVQEEHFRRPSQHDSAFDKALEAVCLKAMAAQPEDRYPTPKALADDLDRWMADEPVSAWREPLARRARRWARRNRTAVTAAAVALVAGVVGLSAVLAVQTRAKADIARSLASETRANTALAAANSDLTRSQAAVQARYDLAVEAIKTFHTGVSEDFLLKQEQFKDVRDRLLKSASDFYGKLGALLGKESNLASRRALWQANYEVALLTGKIGKAEDALAAHRQVLAARQALASEAPADLEIRADVAWSLTDVAILLLATGKSAAAEAEYRKALAIRQKLADDNPAVTHFRSQVADSHNNLGNLLAAKGKSAAAEAEYRKALALRQKLADDNPAVTYFRDRLADNSANLGLLLEATSKSAAAEAEFRKALALYQKLADDNPAVTQFRGGLAGSHHKLGWVLSQTGRSAAAEAEYRKAMAFYQKLADDNPAVTQFHSHLALSHHALGSLLRATGKSLDAEAEFRKALAIRQKLANDNPAVTEFRSNLASNRSDLGLLLAATGKPSEAEAEHRKALALRQELADDNPTVAQFRSNLGGTHNNLGLVLSAMGQSAAAESQYRKALAIQQKLADDNPAVTQFRVFLANHHYNLGNLLANSGRPSAAEAEYREGIAIQQKLADDNPAVTQYRSSLAASLNNLVKLLSTTAKSLEAEAEFRKALAIGQKLVDDNPSVSQFRGELAGAQHNLAMLLAANGKASAAEAECRKALTSYQKLADDNPKVPAYRNGVASAYTNIADVARSLGRPAEARDGYERAIAIRESLIQEDLRTTIYRSHLAYCVRRRGLARRETGDPADAAADARRALALYDGLPARSSEEWFETACCHAALAGLAGRDGSGISAPDAASEAEQAMALLARPITMGYRNPDAYRTESALDPLRNRPDFQLLMMDLSFPTEPFAQ